MRAFEILVEAAPPELTIGGLLYRPGRHITFVDLIRAGHEFTKKDGSKVKLDPSQADEIWKILSDARDKKDRNLPVPRGGVDLRLQQGGTINSAELIKDDEIMGKRGASLQKKEKSAAGIQPSDFFGMDNIEKEKTPKLGQDIVDISTFIEAGAIRAGDLHSKIVKNPKLKELDPVLSKAIISSANEINSGSPATVPPNLNETQLRAFRDYATEYLGILSLIKGGEAVNFPKSEQFYTHLNKMGSSNLADLLIYWPKNKANPLADAIALINDQGKSMAVSSKAGETGKGAAPSLDSLEIPDDLKKGAKKKTYSDVIDFMEAGNQATGFIQPFALANKILEKKPDSMPIAKTIGKFDIQKLETAFKEKKSSPDIKKYLKLNEIYETVGRKSDAPELAKLRYYVGRELINAVNKGDALPNLKSAVLEILGYNFIQLETKISGNQLNTLVKWPAKVDGEVLLYNKYGGAQTGGKLSWYLK